MKTLQQLIAEADRQKVAVGHFNISDLVALKAVYEAAREVNVPVETQQQNCRNWAARCLS
jgi:fructose-bisphosphate aldolase class II